MLAGVRLAALREVAGGLELGDEQGNTHGVADAVVVTAPAPQAADLLERSPEPAARVAALRALAYAPAVMVLAGVRLDRPPGWSAARPDAGPLAEVRNECAKGREPVGGAVAVVARLAPAESAALLDAPDEAALDRALPALAALLGPAAADPAWAQVKRWRFAVPAGRLDPEEVNRPGSRVVRGGRRGDRRELRRRRPPRRVRQRRAGGAQGHGDGPGAAGVSARSRVARGAAAGAVAACVWSAAEPLAARALRTGGFGDVRLLGRMVPGAGDRWPVAGAIVHAVNGAAFGAAFALAGAGGPRAGLAWAGAETVATWPGMALIDRVHPDRRSGHWPPLATNPRVFAQEALMHARLRARAGRPHPEAARLTATSARGRGGRRAAGRAAPPASAP